MGIRFALALLVLLGGAALLRPLPSADASPSVFTSGQQVSSASLQHAWDRDGRTAQADSLVDGATSTLPPPPAPDSTLVTAPAATSLPPGSARIVERGGSGGPSIWLTAGVGAGLVLSSSALLFVLLRQRRAR